MYCKRCNLKLEKGGVVVQMIVPATKEQIEEQQLADIHVVTDHEGQDFLFLVNAQNFFCDMDHAAEFLISKMTQA